MDKNNSLLRDRSRDRSHHNHNNNKTNTNNNNNTTTSNTTTSSSDFVLQWGNRKRLRCMKLQQQQAAAAAAVKDKEQPAAPPPISQRSITPRVDHHRRAVKSPNNHQQTKDFVSNGVSYINLRQRSPAPHRVLRNSENTIGGGMKGQSNGSARRVCSPDRQVQDKRSGSNNNNNKNNIINNNNGGGSGSSETGHDGKKVGGSSPGNEGIPVVWPPKFTIGLTNKEKEEDFLAIKGCKLPQRPKKRAKFIQRTINLVTPGGWLCDLTLERYEVREKKITKKRPRGIKAMGIMESESE